MMCLTAIEKYILQWHLRHTSGAQRLDRKITR